MSNAVTDTHGLIWYLEDSPLLGAKAVSGIAAYQQRPADSALPD